MSRKNDIGGLEILVIFAIVVIVTIGFVVESIGIFAIDNINILFAIFLFILGLVIMNKLKKHNSAIISRPILKKRKIRTVSIPAQYPLFISLYAVINNYGIEILSLENSQKCRGLLKDFDMNQNNEQIHIIYYLLNKQLYSLLSLQGKKQYKKRIVVKNIYKSLVSTNTNQGLVKKTIELIVEVLVASKRLTIKEKKVRIDLLNSLYRIKHIISLLAYFFRRCYKTIIPLSISMAGIALAVFCFSTNNFTIIDRNSMSRNASTEYIRQDTAPQIYAYVNSFALNLRSLPSASSEIVTQLKQNNRVQVVDKSGNWWHIKIGNYEGYVNSQYLSSYPVQEK